MQSFEKIKFNNNLSLFYARKLLDTNLIDVYHNFYDANFRV